MKKLIIVLLTYLQIGNLNAEVDSLNYSLDSNYSIEINSDSILIPHYA
jgi:hypothetical protein